MTHSPLLTKLNEYDAWRTNLEKTIANYRDWLANSPQTDSVKELRLHDMLQTIKHDRIVITFLADDAKGKTEAINAMFFSDLNCSIFPTDGNNSSSMCSTEIYWNQDEEPCIKLLPISTRRTEDTLAYLKTTPNVWQKYQLNMDSPEDIQSTLNKLTEQLEVTQTEAISLGLWNANDKAMVASFEKTGRIKVPVWRHAVINYPHPALKNGLIIIDTPSLDKLNAEPELMLNSIPNSDAAVFITGADIGVTQNDASIWNEFIRNKIRHQFVLLNKIDVLWDKQKSKQSLAIAIERQVNMTAHQLHASPEIVFPISAQQALLAKTNNNIDLLSESNLLSFETTLGERIIQSKHELIGKTIANECSSMIKFSRKTVQQRRINLQSQLDELKDLKGKSVSDTQLILKKVIAEKKRYEASIPTFNLANEKISKHGKNLLKHLSVEYLDSSIKQSRKEIGESWTTVGLNQGMRNVMKQANELADFVTTESKKIKKLADHVYDVFQSKHGFEIFEAPELNMADFLNNMRALEKITDDFCKDPINVMTEKHFLIRKFFLGLGTQKQKIFEQARKECEHWLLDVLSTLKSQMTEHKAMLTERTKNLMKVNDSAKALDQQLKLIEKEYAQLSIESKAMDNMLLHIVTAMQPAIKAQQAEKKKLSMEKNLDMPAMSFMLPSDSNATSTPA
jgi:hypothetical protein